MRKATQIGLMVLLTMFVMNSLVFAQSDPLKQKYDFALDSYNNGKNTDDATAKDKYFDEALAKFTEIVEEDANYSPAWYHIGMIYHTRNQFSQAMEPLINVTRIAETDTAVTQNTVTACTFFIGQCFEELGQEDEALNYYIKTMEFEPDNVHYINKVATTYQNMGQLDKAVPLLEKLINTPDDNDYKMYARSVLRIQYFETGRQTGDYSKVKKMCESIAGINPDDVDNNIMLAQIYEAEKSTQNAINAYTLVIAQEPDKCDIIARLGTLYSQKGDLVTSLKKFEEAEACANDPASTFEDSDYYKKVRAYGWGYALYTKKEYEDAISKFDLVIALDPAFNNIMKFKAQALLALREFDQAEAVATEAIKVSKRGKASCYSMRGYIRSNMYKQIQHDDIGEEGVAKTCKLIDAYFDFENAGSGTGAQKTFCVDMLKHFEENEFPFVVENLQDKVDAGAKRTGEVNSYKKCLTKLKSLLK